VHTESITSKSKRAPTTNQTNISKMQLRKSSQQTFQNNENTRSNV